MTGRAELLGIFDALAHMHAWRGWHWDEATDPFEIAVGAILVQNTAWTNVERALRALRAAGALRPAAIHALDDARLEDLVRSSGQFRQKAAKLRAFLATCESVGGFPAAMRLPPEALRRDLLETWGIGPETADCIVLYASRQPAFVVDAYTIRLFRRLDLGPANRDYTQWQRWFTDRLEVNQEAWARYHSLVVLHGKHLCRKRAPRCGDCSLRERCLVGAGEVPEGAQGL